MGAYYKEKEFGGLVEQSVVWEAAQEARLHTAVLARLRENQIEEAIQTLESSLGVTEVLLETCQTPSCSAASSNEVREAKELIGSYRNKYPDAGSR